MVVGLKQTTKKAQVQGHAVASLTFPLREAESGGVTWTHEFKTTLGSMGDLPPTKEKINLKVGV